MKGIGLILGALIFVFSCRTTSRSTSVFAKTKTFRLAKPIIKVDSVFFKESATVSIEMNHRGTEIFYIEKDFQGLGIEEKCKGVMTISDRKIITATARHADFLKSETSSVEVLKVNAQASAAKVSLSPLPNDNYPGNGAKTLIDLKKGSFQFRAGDWLGFQSDTVQIDFEFDKPETIASVGISFLEDTGSWIFLPERIEVLINEKIIAENIFPAPVPGKKPEFKFATLSFSGEKTKQISLRILNLESIPNWHPGKGLPSWLFIDEVFFVDAK